jgi:hypothetical protein
MSSACPGCTKAIPGCRVDGGDQVKTSSLVAIDPEGNVLISAGAHRQRQLSKRGVPRPLVGALLSLGQ